MRWGGEVSKAEYAVCMVVAYGLVAELVLARALPVSALATWLSLPLAVLTARTVYTETSSPLNATLAATGQTALAFSVLFALGMVLG